MPVAGEARSSRSKHLFSWGRRQRGMSPGCRSRRAVSGSLAACRKIWNTPEDEQIKSQGSYNGMGQTKQRPECVLGFYQTVQQPSGEISGGLLVTSHLGRPIEFQCSLPVRPNPTQQTLYGATLRPFLVGELIASALRDKLDVKPDVLLVNDPDAVAPQTWQKIPILCFAPLSTDGPQREFRGDVIHTDPTTEDLLEQAIKLLEKHVPETAELKEPLNRVEQALKEAMGQAA